MARITIELDTNNPNDAKDALRQLAQLCSFEERVPGSDVTPATTKRRKAPPGGKTKADPIEEVCVAGTESGATLESKDNIEEAPAKTPPPPPKKANPLAKSHKDETWDRMAAGPVGPDVAAMTPTEFLKWVSSLDQYKPKQLQEAALAAGMDNWPASGLKSTPEQRAAMLQALANG